MWRLKTSARRSKTARPLLTMEHTDPAVRVLFVTNMWPNKNAPDYGIFIKRQVDSLIAAGLRCGVLFLRSYRSQLAYPLAALRLLAWTLRCRRRYALVHGHGGETAPVARCYPRAPVIVSYCGDDLLGTPRVDGTIPRRHLIRRAMLRCQARLLTATITKFAEMERALPRRVQDRGAVIPDGVDRDLFSPLGRTEACRRLGWPSDERVALFAADPAVERKRHWLAVKVCELAGRQIPKLRLHVASAIPPTRCPRL